jgi:hypothetical protein
MSADNGTELARHALEQVCSGSDPSAAVGVYSQDFHDHVNASEYRGHDGIRQSLGLYQLVFTGGRRLAMSTTSARMLETQELEQHVRHMYEEVAHHPDATVTNVSPLARRPD